MFKSKNPIPASKNVALSKKFFLVFPMLILATYFGIFSTIKLLQNGENSIIIALIPAIVSILVVSGVFSTFWLKKQPTSTHSD